MPELCPPLRHAWNGPTVFLAGSIEMGRAEPWQARVVEALSQTAPEVLCFNPRRAQWDASWTHDPHDGPFAEQVHWELDHLKAADLILFVFDPQTQSPVTLLELGLCLGQCPGKVVVVCPTTFWRHGNVVITCERAQVPVFEHVSEGLDQLTRFLRERFSTAT